MTQSAISHQLKLLRQAGLVGAKRDGRNIIYSLADEHVSTIISQGWDHINE
jgi:ArsR family transcriptional regulator